MLDLGGTNVALGLVVGEGDSEVGGEAEDDLAVVFETAGQRTGMSDQFARPVPVVAAGTGQGSGVEALDGGQFIGTQRVTARWRAVAARRWAPSSVSAMARAHNWPSGSASWMPRRSRSRWAPHQACKTLSRWVYPA